MNYFYYIIILFLTVMFYLFYLEIFAFVRPDSYIRYFLITNTNTLKKGIVKNNYLFRKNKKIYFIIDTILSYKRNKCYLYHEDNSLPLTLNLQSQEIKPDLLYKFQELSIIDMWNRDTTTSELLKKYLPIVVLVIGAILFIVFFKKGG